MVRLLGVDIPDKKNVEIALTSLFGIGRTVSINILKEAKIETKRKTSTLKPDEINNLKNIIEKKYKVEGTLRKDIMLNIKHMKDVGTYKGLRHTKSLPVNGQRTKTNSRTRRGNVRKTMGSGKRKLDKK